MHDHSDVVGALPVDAASTNFTENAQDIYYLYKIMHLRLQPHYTEAANLGMMFSFILGI